MRVDDLTDQIGVDPSEPASSRSFLLKIVFSPALQLETNLTRVL